MRPQNVPDYAVPFPLDAHFPEVQAQTIAAMRSQQEHENANTVLIYSIACQNWLLANTRNRGMGLPIQPKPVASNLGAVNAVEGEDHVAWVWISPGDPAGTPCPDLPVAPIPQPGNQHIGGQIWGAYWQCFPDDTMSDGAVICTTLGTFKKQVGMMGAYYLKVA